MVVSALLAFLICHPEERCISGALGIPETFLLIGVAIADAALLARLYIVSRRS